MENVAFIVLTSSGTQYLLNDLPPLASSSHLSGGSLGSPSAADGIGISSLPLAPAPPVIYPPAGARYTHDAVRGMLTTMGCKPRYSHKAVKLLFSHVARLVKEGARETHSRRIWTSFPWPGNRIYVCVPRHAFMELVCTTLAEYNYKFSPSSDEVKIASGLKEGRRYVVVLLCGTSGSGKSTLAAILAARLGIQRVVSTDSVRHMLRSFTTAEADPLLDGLASRGGEGGLTPHERVIKGYKAQCEVVVEHLLPLLECCQARQQSMVVEGVHLSINFVVQLMKRFPAVLPFLVYIKAESRHVERMAVRAKYMTLDPHKNKYIKNMGNIRWIQDYLVRKSDKHLIPKVENTNIDRSVGIIHLTILGWVCERGPSSCVS
ncbi:MAG: hypothetical protein WDW36_006848 [Sanguina aurantia]